LRWRCEPRSTGLCAIFVGQSTEQSATLTFTLNEGSSLHSSSLTRSEYVCIHISFSSYVLWTTLCQPQMTALQMPVPCSQHCNSISNKAAYPSARTGDFLRLSEQFFHSHYHTASNKVTNILAPSYRGGELDHSLAEDEFQRVAYRLYCQGNCNKFAIRLKPISGQSSTRI